MQYRTRFAPSPTGYMHLGNAWVAFLNWLWTREHHGKIVLRIEDIDEERSRPVYTEAIKEDLLWLGLDWDEGPDRTYSYGRPLQSARYAFYKRILDDWKQRNILYPCFCSRSRIRSVATAPHEGEIPNTYDGHCRDLTEKEQRELSRHKRPSYRFRMETQDVSFVDLFSGLHKHRLYAGKDDFIVERADHVVAYQFAVSADDSAMGITHVFRGNDLLPSTYYQAVLFHELHRKVPVYAHVPLLVDSKGVRLSKRQKGITLRDLRREGWSPEKILGMLLYWAGALRRMEPVSSEQALHNISLKDCLYLHKKYIAVPDF